MSQLLAILGPTASGKSALALELARRLNGEIISCDSMAVYRDLDIGTAKPSPTERAEIPHHCLDLVDITERYDVQRFQDDAESAICGVRKRGRVPILCGGTGLYARAVLYGFSFRPSDPEIQRQVRDQYEMQGPENLLRELEAADPERAAACRDNHRHLQRTVEVLRITGSVPQPEPDRAPRADATQFILIPTPEYSDLRIRQRVHAMLDAGWIEEAQGLIQAGLLTSPTARQALGYPLIGNYLAGSISSMSELSEKLTIATRRYAKRQRTWFRHQHPGAEILEFNEPVSLAVRLQSIADRIASLQPACCPPSAGPQ
ncbi:MAG TPA: tRNA (adenosine(37)-N6)-dimethylallyltransferase MiaA [Lentisphaeria bacterium]|jgi:tRNA dimethylallyltransferase|nr:tRNA (adenosine(37)-N6)-dimethylallyltransferase MiaA [Lentisphaeria bacterium]